MSLLKKLASETAIYGLSSIVGRLLNYLLVPMYTRIFAQGEYGVVSELYAWVGVLQGAGQWKALFRRNQRL